MAQILVRKLTEEAHRSLKARAQAENRSAEALAREILERELLPDTARGFGDLLVAVWAGADLEGIDLDQPKDPYTPPDYA